MLPVDYIELMAVVGGAIYGILLAVRSDMDLTGIFAVAFAAAFGGGTLRDLCLDRHPLFWIESAHYPVIVFFISLLAVAIPKLVFKIENHLRVPDALGTASFAIAGAAIAHGSGTSLFLAAIFGVMTGTSGGILAEIICNRIPSTFRPGSPLNITCCFLGAWVFLLTNELLLPRPWAMAVGVLFTTVFRLVSFHFGWTLGFLNRLTRVSRVRYKKKRTLLGDDAGEFKVVGHEVEESTRSDEGDQ
jgi:uncharacterized membrane protein YeiH